MKVDAVSDTVLIWIMIFLNLSFLIFRITLRRRQTEGLRLSDLLIFNAFLVILTCTALITCGNAREIAYTKRHPGGPPDPVTGLPNPHLEPVSFGFKGAYLAEYGQMFYACLLLNVTALWVTKAAFVAFYYEVFPKHSRAIRYSLHATTIYVACAGVANFAESVFWCLPVSSTWSPVPTGKVCSSKLNPAFNGSTFAMHSSTTLLIAILPLLLIGKVELRRSELTFVVTMISLGILSFAGSISAFAIYLSMDLKTFDVYRKHATYVSTMADQNAMFLAACLSPLRLRVGRKVVLENAPLVIEVEKTWNVDFDIVESWGHRPGDPFGSDMEMRTEILGGGSETFASKDTH